MEQSCQDKVQIAIVGAGPAGIYCALNILKLSEELNFDNFSIDIFDKSQALRTILPTGNGRCNITNSNSDIKDFCKNYPRGEKFLYSIFSKHFIYDTIDFFNSIGIQTYTQQDGRIFPKSNSAKEVKDKMLSALKNHKNAKIINKEINSLDDLKKYNKIIISTGSKISKNFLNDLKQPYIPFRKALCELIIKDFNFPKGVSIKAIDGDFIFTQKGISGPLALKISSIKAFDEFPYEINIKLFDVEELKNLIKENPKKLIGNLISKFIPKSLTYIICEDFNKKASEISNKTLEKYSTLNLIVINTSNKGEIVNAGGINLDYIDKNCKSKLNPNLWFCGEVLNIDGFCGGFNLQNCWSSAYVVAKDVIKSIIKE